MNKRLLSGGIFVSVLLSCLMVTGAFAARDEIVFDVPYGRVTFNHNKHSDALKIHCLRCHHTWRRNETAGKKCVECHQASAEGKTPSVKDAFHITCKGCHDEAGKANKLTGPTMCTGCHVKAK